MKYPFEIRQMKTSKMLDRAFWIYRSNFIPISIFALLIYGGFTLLMQIWQFYYVGDAGSFLDSFDSAISGSISGGEIARYPLPYDSGSLYSAYALFAITSIFVSSFSAGGVIMIAANYYHGIQSRPSENLRSAGRLYPHFILLAFCNLLFFAGLVLLVFLLVIFISIPIFLMGAWVFYVIFIIAVMAFVAAIITSVDIMSYSALICEKKIAFTATIRGFVLTFKRIGKSFWVALLLLAMQLLLQLSIEAIFSFIGSFLDEGSVTAGVATALSIALRAFLDALIFPIVNIGIMLLYFDSRIRLEGYDLELQVADLRTKYPGSAPVPGSEGPVVDLTKKERNMPGSFTDQNRGKPADSGSGIEDTET